jgi:hypothetical protein
LALDGELEDGLAELGEGGGGVEEAVEVVAEAVGVGEASSLSPICGLAERSFVGVNWNAGRLLTGVVSNDGTLIFGRKTG